MENNTRFLDYERVEVAARPVFPWRSTLFVLLAIGACYIVVNTILNWPRVDPDSFIFVLQLAFVGLCYAPRYIRRRRKARR